jgi:uncharacterized protein YuzE
MKISWIADFDEDADVLYLTAEKKAAIAYEIADEVFVRITESGEIVGITIINLKSRIQKK